MGKKLFVASLPFDFTTEQLAALFAPMGAVESAEMVPDRKSGKSRGFGFVTMVDDAGAQAAMEKLNGSMVGDRKVWITEARPRESGPSKNAGPDGSSGPRDSERGPRGRDHRSGGGGNGRRPSPRAPNPEGGDEDRQPSGFDQLFQRFPDASRSAAPTLWPLWTHCKPALLSH